MKRRNRLFILFFCFFKLRMIFGVECCHNFDCSTRKNCSEVSHCILAGKTAGNKSFAEPFDFAEMELSHFDCWMWLHEINLCPVDKGGCFFVHNHSSYKTFCCAGDLCNNSNNLTCEVKNINVSESLNTESFLTEKSTAMPNKNSNHNSPFYFTYIIIILFVAVFVFLIIILRLSCKKKFPYIRHLFSKRPILMNGVSYVSDRTTCMSKVTNDNFSVSQRLAFTNEVFKASNVYDKCEKKCIGKFGEIWTGKLKIGYNERVVENVAIKIFRPRDETSWETELEMYRYIRNRCQRILTYVGCDKITTYNEVDELWLVTQYIEHGSLHDYLTDQCNERPKWSQVLRICLDIAGGLSYLHEDGSYQTSPHIAGKPSIAHRDLKSRNILIRGNWNACIADLGLAISFHGIPSPTDLHLQVGTQRYMAPEVLEGAINFSRDSFLGIDVYAMALILWEILSQCIDFEELSQSSSREIPRYVQPFEVELGPHITMESLQAWVVNENKRPQMPPQYAGFEDGLTLWKTIIECWDRDAEARLSSSCVYERFMILNGRSATFRSKSPEVIIDLNVVAQDSQPLL